MSDARLVGTWLLVSNEWLTPDGEVAQRPFGEEPVGQLMYSREGTMSAILVSNDRPPEARPREGSAEERAIAFDKVLAYSGTYEVRGEVVVHHVLASSIPSDTGRDRIRGFKLEDDRLILLATPMIVDGVEQVHRIVWRRRGPHEK